MMVASSTLLESSPLKWNPPLLYMQRYHRPCAVFYSNHQPKSKLGRLQIAVKYKHSDAESNCGQLWKNSFEKVKTQMEKAVDSLKKPAIVAVLLGLLMFYGPSAALAASGGRIGGSNFSSRSSSSFSSSITYSVPRTSSSPSWSSSPRYSARYYGGGSRADEATLALLRHPEYCIACYSLVDVKRNIEEGEKRFNQLSIEEREKFNEETLVNVNNIKRQTSKMQSASNSINECIVVTILVAAEGIHKLQPINGSADLKKALQKLGSIPRNKIMAVEVLWTPQKEKDVLSKRELLQNYPLLKPLYKRGFKLGLPLYFAHYYSD